MTATLVYVPYGGSMGSAGEQPRRCDAQRRGPRSCALTQSDLRPKPRRVLLWESNVAAARQTRAWMNIYEATSSRNSLYGCLGHVARSLRESRQ